MRPVQLKKNIYWVGAIDWNLRNFHGYLTQRGSSYNAYLMIDEKIVLIDTVKSTFTSEMIARISHIVDPGKIDYIICNHVEMDHSGSIPDILKLAPNATLLATAAGKKGLLKHYSITTPITEVSTGESLSFGRHSLEFIATPMIHWPDNMLSYCPEERILFSNDSFGQHLASDERFDSDYSYEIVHQEAQKYYANIVLPYGNQVKKALEQCKEIPIEMIAPSHGLIWKNNIGKIVQSYHQWADHQTEERALIIYDTMWNSTQKIAHIIQDTFNEIGIRTKLFNLEYNHPSSIMADVLTSKYICVGSPTLNNNMLPSVAGFLTYLKGLAPQKRIGLAFGSYGWGGQSIDIIEKELIACRLDMLKSIRVQYIPDQETMHSIKETLMPQLEPMHENVTAI